MKIVTVVGTRPQFIKAATISRVIRGEYADKVEEVLVHTGQHFDYNMSNVFYEHLDLAHPKYNLEISGGSHGAMTGRMLEAIESVLMRETPDWLLIYGDTNSTLAGALAAAKLNIPIAHVEAGLRSFNICMPEEINRIITDRIASLLFCPTKTASNNLKSEGITSGVYNVGDVMYDSALFYRDLARNKSSILFKYQLEAGGYILATCHRAENTDNPEKLEAILSAIGYLSEQFPVILPLHPRTRKMIAAYGLTHYLVKPIVIEPVGFLDMVALEQDAKIILTDSGGLQKEAFFYGIPCVTMRDETEWVETIEEGLNCLVGTSRETIIETVQNLKNHSRAAVIINSPYGDGQAANKILDILVLT